MWRRNAARIAVVGACGLLAQSTRARAETVDATSTTMITGRPDLRDGVVHTSVPLFELVSVRATDLHLRGVDDLTVVMSGWGMVSLADPAEGKRGLGDLDVAYAEGTVLDRRIRLRLGRQLLIAGAGRNLAFDGLDLTVRIWRGLGVSAQAGVPVTPRFAVDRGDAMVGGRLYFRPRFDTEAGVSILHVLDNGQIFRQDAALDARVAPVRILALTGFARFSIYDRRLAEGDLAATVQLGQRVELTGDYRRTAPDLFLPRNSIFSVFSQETRDEAGGFVYLKLAARLRFQGQYHAIVNADGFGQDADGKLTASFGSERRTSAGVESRLLDVPSGGGYLMGRAFAFVALAPGAFAAADVSSFFLDTKVNDQSRSYTAAGTLAYDFRPDWRVAVTGIGSVTPFAERRFEGMAKVIYRFTTHVKEVKP
jgi:hypothetical protein